MSADDPGSAGDGDSRDASEPAVHGAGSGGRPARGGPPSRAPTQKGAATPPLRQFSLLAGLALLVGLIAGAGASLFIAVEHHIQHWLWHTLPDSLGLEGTSVVLTVALLVTGALLTYLACQLPGSGGHSPLAGFALDITLDKLASAALAALASLSFGAVLGPEAPLLAVGTALGAMAVRGRPGPVVQVMMLAGAMAAVGAIFGNPLITVILLLEMAVVAGPPVTSLPVLLSALAALASGYVLQVGVAGWSGLGEVQLGLPDLADYPNLQLIDVLVAVPVAALVAALGMAARLLGAEVETLARRNPLAIAVGAAALVGLTASAVALITDGPVDYVLFSGQSALPDYLALTSAGTALVILVGKFAAYALCLGSGFRGGSIFPAIAMGVLIVAGLSTIGPGDLSEAALTATAISAATAATMRLPFIATMLGVMLTHPAGGATTVTAIIGTIVGLLMRLAAEQRVPSLAPPPRDH